MLLLLLMMTIRYNSQGGGGGGVVGGEEETRLLFQSGNQIYLADLDLPQFLLVISKIIFALSSQGRILTLFIPVLFARLCITFHLSRNESCCVVQNFESLICGFRDNFQPCLGDVISPDII